MRLTKLADGIGDIVYKGRTAEREIEGLFSDSRMVEKGGVFFCLTGGERDGHAFAREAVQKGAVAIVAEREMDLDVPMVLVQDARIALAKMSAVFFGHPEEHLKLIGITGTNGKTSTAYMLASILKKADKKVGVIGTLGVEYGEYTAPSSLTTPDPIELYKTFAEMFLRGVEYVVMEVSAHALYYRKVEGLSFSACIFSNLTQDHLDFFLDMERYKHAKMQLFSVDKCPIAVINGDDEVGREIGAMREKTEEKTLYYGLHTPADSFAVITDETLHKTECMLNINDRLCRVSLSLTGKHNVYNALAAATCATELGISMQAIEQGLSEIKRVKGRLDRVGKYAGADIYVDFAHTPDGLEKALNTLKAHCRGRLICLFGCGGNRDKGKRAKMGEKAAKKADFTILTSDNPRYEDPLDIISEIEKGYRRFSVKYVVVPERKRAIEYAMDFLKKDDILLVAGKGGENYQEIMGIKYEFNDQDIIENLLEKKGKYS